MLTGLLSRRRRRSTASTTSSRTPATSRRARSSRIRRSASAAAARSARCAITAKYADHWNFVGGTPEEFARKRDVLAAHCADIGRDPKEIMLVGARPARRGPQLPRR